MRGTSIDDDPLTASAVGHLLKRPAREALKRVAAGETLRKVALSYNVDHSTISRLKARYAAEA